MADGFIYSGSEFAIAKHKIEQYCRTLTHQIDTAISELNNVTAKGIQDQNVVGQIDECVQSLQDIKKAIESISIEMSAVIVATSDRICGIDTYRYNGSIFDYAARILSSL